MKISALVYLTICIGLITNTVFAATGGDGSTVSTEYIEILAVPAAAAMTLTTSTAGATAYDQATVTDTNGFLYSHNSTAMKQITATAVLDSGGANDVTLTAAITGGAGTKTLVNAGTVQVGVLLYNNIAAGGYTKDISWTANGTLAGTKAGNNADKNLVWTVTFTSSDGS